MRSFTSCGSTSRSQSYTSANVSVRWLLPRSMCGVPLKHERLPSCAGIVQLRSAAIAFTRAMMPGRKRPLFSRHSPSKRAESELRRLKYGFW